jgi:cytochrome c oxidase assembly factor CtaG
MSSHLHIGLGSGEFPFLLAIILLFAACQYLLGLVRLRSISRMAIPLRGAISFFIGLLLVWAASGSSLAAYDHSLLTAHMIKHLLLMTVAPALILLGDPLRVFWIGLPSSAHPIFRRAFLRPSFRRTAKLVTNPALCWTVSALTLLAWHVPALCTLGMSSESWHAFEQFSFLFAGILFWWPLIQPWPSPHTAPRWSILLYLFAATLPCDILSGFLAFSDRVVYPMYLSAPRLFGFSVLEDQQCAAALMWTCITLIYLVPAVIICSKLLAPRRPHQHISHKPDLHSSQPTGA